MDLVKVPARGERSERALRLAIAEMYFSGVSTRRMKQVTQITREDLGFNSRFDPKSIYLMSLILYDKVYKD